MQTQTWHWRNLQHSNSSQLPGNACGLIIKVSFCVYFALQKEPTNKPSIYREYSEYLHFIQKHLLLLHFFSYNEVRWCLKLAKKPPLNYNSNTEPKPACCSVTQKNQRFFALMLLTNIIGNLYIWQISKYILKISRNYNCTKIRRWK